ncbi:major tail sheath protein [Luteitalea pratensis]|uniref:Major tail sheath protein n=1 Tax=Luteitalea pratensis TaxID=1855912 RepID=A0A143PL89_LUTPR|nr:phage tail sheath C-terminal domain-containing protein [Luteitalea pratensis]AMY09352.1 major tail sheath protein [Luteitalea pratensis]
MPEYLSPGVHIDEIEPGPRPIEGVPTSTAGCLGETARGPLEPRLITGFEEFKRIYGGYLSVDISTLPFAVEGFFMNGGRRMLVARIAAADAVAALGDHDGTLRLSAIGPGDWGNRIAVKIEPGSLQIAGQPATHFKLTAMCWDVAPPTDPPIDPTAAEHVTNSDRREPTLLEIYDNLVADPDSVDFYERRLNGSSSLLRAQRLAPGVPQPLALVMLASLGNAGANGSAVTVLDYRGRELPPLPDSTAYKTGLQGFAQIDEIAILIAPAHHVIPNLTTEIIAHCTLLRDRFAILHSAPGTDTLANITAIRPPQDTAFAAFYFPWINVFNPLIDQDSLVPPSGHIAGIYAKTDVERGVFKAPVNEIVVGARSLEFQINNQQQDILNAHGVNCVRLFPSRGILVWGARTASSNSQWRYISVRRLLLFLGESIDEGTQWVVFEPNDERLWARVKQAITQFLGSQWRSGALMGATQQEAFFVTIDRTTMTQDDIDNGRLICLIGVAPLKPKEFVMFRLARLKDGSEITEF